MTNFPMFTLILTIVISVAQIRAKRCNLPLLKTAQLSASSSANEREPDKAFLRGLGAWSSDSSDNSQFLIVDLERLQNITAIATQGRQNTDEYVQEFRIQYGVNGDDYAKYKDVGGNERYFKGNKDGNSIITNVFDTPIIARYIRINPTKWVDRISMRIELYGCDYVAETIGFRGKGAVRMNLVGSEIFSLKELIRLRLKTNQADGIIMYSKSSQYDVIALQLKENKVVLNMKLGGQDKMTQLIVGSLLDDNLWHDIILIRDGKKLSLSVDRVKVKTVMETYYHYLNLNQEIFFGGVPNFNNDGIIVYQNFSGCMENVFINSTNVISKVKQRDGRFQTQDVILSCIDDNVIPVTFTSRKGFIKLTGYQSPSFNVSFTFRTFEKFGALLYNDFFTDGYVKLYLDRGKLVLELKDKNPYITKIDTMFDEKMNDGKWHQTSLHISTNRIELVVDMKPSITRRLFYMESGPSFYLGGEMEGNIGFLGCIRNIYVDSTSINPESFSKYDLGKDLLHGACQMFDRCIPNPCQHNGICTQDWNDYNCHCQGTGYGGDLCHTSNYFLSCDDYRIAYPKNKEAKINIDVDGAGYLKPFPVECKFLSNGVTETYISHNSENIIDVDGFEAPGSFVHNIQYEGDMDEIIALVNRSRSCKQYVKYQCKNARLFSPSRSYRAVNLVDQFEPYSWLVGRDYQKLDYWGDSQPGTRQCSCGLSKSCVDEKKDCNCDVTNDNRVKFDEGFLQYKNDLPIRQLRFGDTGTITDDKRGEISLGPLICQNDLLLDNKVTFTLPDAVLTLPSLESEISYDISFQFKTTHAEGVLLYATGPSNSLKVTFVTKSQIQFQVISDGYTWTSNSDIESSLNDDEWHIVHASLNHREVQIKVDSKGSTSKRPSSQSKYREIVFDSPLYIGATNEGDSGYVGCLSALLINGKMMDLKQMATRGVFGVLPGCVGRCESNPCLNNGTCIEGYSGFTCNCRWTAFNGIICADEIGAYLTRGKYVRFDFPNMLNTVSEHIRIGFVTTEARGLLFAITSHSGEYFNLLVTNSGYLRLVFDYGFERQEMIIDDRKLINAQHHDIRIERTEQGSKLSIYVDNYKPRVYKFNIGPNQDNQLNQLKSIYLGGNESMSAVDMFSGCISRVEFNNYYILNLLFQSDKPFNIHSFPSSIKKDSCEIEASTLPTFIQRPSSKPTIQSRIGEDTSTNTAMIYGVVLAVLVLLLIVILIIIGRFVSRQKGEYRTHEDVGSKNATDADTAVLHGQTGHGVKKNHEYFI